MTSPAEHAATVAEGFAVGLHECKTCPTCATTFAAVHPVCPKCAQAERANELERERDEARREADIQMGNKLAAQITLKAICDVLNLPMVSLGNGWTEATPKILSRIETIVDEADRGFRERDAAEARVEQLETALRECARRAGCEKDHIYTTDDACQDIEKIARAALTKEPA